MLIAARILRVSNCAKSPGITLTTCQVARGESQTNLANVFLIIFAQKDISGESISVKFLVTGPPEKVSYFTPQNEY